MPEPVQIIRTSWCLVKCLLQGCSARDIKKKQKKKKKKKKKLVATLKKFYERHHDLVSPYNVVVSRIVSGVFANDEP